MIFYGGGGEITDDAAAFEVSYTSTEGAAIAPPASLIMISRRRVIKSLASDPPETSAPSVFSLLLLSVNFLPHHCS